MKKVYFLLAVLFSTVASFAQTFDIQILDNNGGDVTNGFYSVPSVPASQGSYLDLKFKIKNNGSQATELMIRRENVQMPAGFNNTICIDGFCYPAVQDSPNGIVNIASGATDSTFYGTFNNLQGTSGDLCVTYIIYNAQNSAEFVTVRAYYGACLTASVAENTAESVMLSAFPNPANGMVNIKYNIQGEGQLMVTDITGKTVKTVRLNAGSQTLALDITDLRPGVYVYSVQVAGKRIISKKLAVR